MMDKALPTEHKTLSEWFRYLAPPIRDKAIYEVKRTRRSGVSLGTQAYSLGSAINNFTWDQTIDGDIFWRSIYKDINNKGRESKYVNLDSSGGVYLKSAGDPLNHSEIWDTIYNNLNISKSKGPSLLDLMSVSYNPSLSNREFCRRYDKRVLNVNRGVIIYEEKSARSDVKYALFVNKGYKCILRVFSDNPEEITPELQSTLDLYKKFTNREPSSPF